jgi:hypothetical protein
MQNIVFFFLSLFYICDGCSKALNLELANFILTEEDGAVASIFFIFLCPLGQRFL